MKILQKMILSTDVTIIGTVRGLVSEAEAIADLLESQEKPELILIGISPEELEGLSKYLKEPFEMDLSDYELLYGLKLKEFGKVRMPIPSYVTIIEFSKSKNVDLVAIDLDEKMYNEQYTEQVSLFDLLRYSYRKGHLWNKHYDFSSPENFAISWDKEVIKLKGYKKLELLREQHFADKIKEIISNNKYKRVLVIMEIERLDGTLQLL
ncbi:MAG: hypothetical protein ACP5NL_06165 [Thermoplasmata archaeon]